jgi:hypothetical protein
MIYTVDGDPQQGIYFCFSHVFSHPNLLGITGGFGGDRRVEYIMLEEMTR